MGTKDDTRNKFDEARNKSEDNFEQSLTYISAGALGLSLTFIEKIIPVESPSHIWTLILGWTFLGLTLFLNLVSHLIASYYSRKSQDDFDISDDKLYEKIDKRNRNMTLINWTTVVLLILGITSIIVFTSINYSNKAKKACSETCSNGDKKCCREESQIKIENNPVFINNIGKTDTTITKYYPRIKKNQCEDTLNKNNNGKKN